MMNIDLTQADIANLLAALNAIDVKGKDAMVAVLKLMQKLEAAIKPAVQDGAQEVQRGSDPVVE